MHNKRQAQTKRRNSRKGKKLKGLTRQEATLRAKKAWITKRQRYRYYAKRSFADYPSEEEYGKHGILPDEFQGEKGIFAHRGSLSDELERQAKEFVETGQLHKDFDLTGATEKEKALFHAQMAAYEAKKRAEKERLLSDAREATRAKGIKESEGDLSYTDKESVKGRQVAASLSEPINKNTKFRGVALRPINAFDDQAGAGGPSLQEGGFGIVQHHDQPELVRIPSKIPGKTEIVKRPPPLSEPELRKSVRKRVKDLKLDQLQINEEDLKDYEDAVVKSFLAPTEVDRHIAQGKAQRLSRRIAQSAQKAYLHNQELARIRKLEGEPLAGTATPKKGALLKEPPAGEMEPSEYFAKQEKLKYQKAAVERRKVANATKRIRTQRIQPLTIEDVLAHKRLPLKDFVRDPDFTKHPIEAIKNRYWTSGYTRNKYKAIKSGDLTIGIGPRKHDGTDWGQVNNEKATLRIGPNKEWFYTVKDPTPSDPTRTTQHRIPYWDTADRSKSDPRFAVENIKEEILLGDNRRHQIYTTEGDVLLPQTERFKFRSGIRKARVETPLPKGVASEEFVPITGLSHPSSKTISSGEHKKIKQVRQAHQDESGTGRPDSFGRWVDATDEEYQAALAQQADKPYELAREKTVPHKKRITYMDPKDLILDRKEKDSLKFRIGSKRLGEVSLGEGRANNALLAYHHAGERIDRERRSQEQADRRDQELIAKYGLETFNPKDPVSVARLQNQLQEEPSGHVKSAVVALATSTYYGSQRRFREGHGADTLNRAWEKVIAGSPSRKAFSERHGIPIKIAKVNEAYMRPGLERAVNFKYQLKHPFSSLEGDGGLDLGSWRYRKHFFLRDGPQIIAERAVEREARRIDRVLKTQEFVQKNAYRGMQEDAPIMDQIKGALARHRAEPLRRHVDYKNFYEHNGTLVHAKQLAEDTINKEATGSPAYVAALKLRARVRALLAQHAEDVINEHNQPEINKDFLPAVIPKTPTRIDRWVGGNFNTNEKAFAVGVGVLAAAGGVAYGVHRYQEHKKEAEQRKSFYNKALPPKFNVHTPNVRTTGRYVIPHNNLTDEFLVGGKKVPVQWGVGLKKRTVTLRPEDRGYPAKAKIGITGIRPGIKGTGGGSIRESIFFDQAATGNLKKTFKPTGGQVVVGGKKLPIRATIGNQHKVKLKAANPNRLSTRDRENIIWAFKGTPDEERVKRFFSEGKTDRIVDMFDDPDVIRRIQKSKGSKFMRELESSVESSKTPIHLIPKEEAYARASAHPKETWVEGKGWTMIEGKSISATDIPSYVEKGPSTMKQNPKSSHESKSANIRDDKEPRKKKK